MNTASPFVTATRRLIRVGHSPDPDDAFMFHALANGKIDTGEYEFVHELVDIETLNRRAFAGELELTAISLHAYAYLTDRVSRSAPAARAWETSTGRWSSRPPRCRFPRCAAKRSPCRARSRPLIWPCGSRSH